MKTDYLERILTARVYDVAIETPLEPAPALSGRLGSTLLLKREDMQPVFSFKLRGAYNKMANLSVAQRRRGVIAASAGNHAQGVALAANHLRCRATIVMPATTPQIKIAAVTARGARVVLFGDSYDEAYAHSLRIARRENLTFVHPYDDPDVIAGQGTIGMEILRQHGGPIDAIFVAVGGGGLIAGDGGIRQAPAPGDPDHRRGAGRCRRDGPARLRPATACGSRRSGFLPTVWRSSRSAPETFRLCRELVDEMILVDNDAICAAIKDVFEDTRSILEPAGALAIAGAKAYAERRKQIKGQTYVAVACGANMNFDRLRFVAERAELGEKREAILAVTIPERPGSFKQFCSLLGAAQHHRVQLSLRRPRARRMCSSACRCADREETAQAGRAAAPQRAADARFQQQRNGQAARAPPGGRPRALRSRTRSFTASSSRSALAR